MVTVWRLREVGGGAWVGDLDVHGPTPVDDQREAKQFSDRAAAQRAAIGINRRWDRPPVCVIEGAATPVPISSAACR